jgi:hypothetical protein
MPFAVVALILGAASLFGYAVSTNSGAGGAAGGSAYPAGALPGSGFNPASFETAAVGVVVVIALIIMLVPGALVRVLYGRRPVPGSSGGALTAEERAMTRFDREEGRLGGEEP